MHDLVTVKSNLNNFVITSLEVAEMVEKDHKELLKSIRRYTNQFNEGKISPVDFWTESTYSDSKGEIRPCYNITKMGCEFIAHKTTGVKGTLFTAQYIKRFHEMEEAERNSSTLKIDMETDTGVCSKRLIPPANPWFETDYPRICRVAKGLKVDIDDFLLRIISYIGKKYSIGTAHAIYYEENGCKVWSCSELIAYFPQLQELTREYLDCVENSIGLKK